MWYYVVRQFIALEMEVAHFFETFYLPINARYISEESNIQ